MPKRLPLLLALLALAGCSKGEDEAPPPLSLVREIPAASLVEAESLAAEARLRCANPADCPANVGLFVATKPDGVLTCTAFLVEEDVVATNSHCFPNVVKQLGDLCAERVSLILPASGGKPEATFACKEFLGSSERPNALSPDLALFRLQKKTGRAPLPLNRAGVEPSAKLQAYKVNPGEGASGTLVHQSCLAVDRSYRFPIYERATDAIFTVGDCRSVPGNSGSPLLNAKGEAVGIFQTDLTVTSENVRKVWGPHLLPGEDFAPLALGTSLRCLRSTERFELASDCQPVDDQLLPKPRIDDFLPSLNEKRQALLSQAHEHLPKALRWDFFEVKAQALVREETLKPACFQPTESWLADFELIESPGRYLEEVTLPGDLPVIQSKIRFNRYMQVSAESVLLKTNDVKVAFSPESVAQRGASRVSIDAEESELSLCP